MQATDAAFERLAPALEARRAAGLGRWCHGDLHLGNIVVEEGPPTLFDCIEFNDRLSRIDVLSINCPHTPATYHLMNARRLKLMKPSAVIANTSRGEVVDENALTRGLRARELGGAGLDVYEHGAAINPRLRELPNVVLLPHMGSATIEGRIEMGERAILNIRAFADGHRPPDQVLP